MKKILSWLLILCLLLPGLALGEEEEEEILLDDLLEEVPSEGSAESEDGDYIIDEETGETFLLTETEQEHLDTLLEENPEEDDGIDPDSLDLNPNLPDNVLNILLIGVDTRSDDPQEIVGRGDTQIIVSINRDTGAISMASILRDSLVSIPGYRNKTKINSAFMYGCNKIKNDNIPGKVRSGAALAMRTVNKNFQMNIENYVAINFNGLASIIDALGGIDIELTKAEAKYINSYLKKHPPAYDNKAKGERVPLEAVAGVHHLDGVQAVMYARTRSLKGENDFNRTDRQRNLLDLLLKKVLSDLDITTLMDLIDTAVTYADTNLNFQTLFELARSLLPVLMEADSSASLFEQMRIPMDKSYSYDTYNGASVVRYNMTKHATALHEFIYGAYYPAK